MRQALAVLSLVLLVGTYLLALFISAFVALGMTSDWLLQIHRTSPLVDFCKRLLPPMWAAVIVLLLLYGAFAQDKE